SERHRAERERTLTATKEDGLAISCGSSSTYCIYEAAAALEVAGHLRCSMVSPRFLEMSSCCAANSLICSRMVACGSSRRSVTFPHLGQGTESTPLNRLSSSSV